MRICTNCNVEKELSEFEKHSKNGYRKICNKCKNIRDHIKKKETGAYDRRREKQTHNRQKPEFRAKYVLYDSNNTDKNKGFVNDLTLEYINELIPQGCTYCGIELGNDKKIKIGIDRIDNNQPHNQNNLVSCCSRCNFIRRNIPYNAWLLMVPAVRQAVTEGLLDDWEWGFKRHFHNR